MLFRTSMGIFLGTLTLIFGLSRPVFARPEYAVKVGVVNCAACHVSPFGGGARNTYGKSFASRNLGFAPYSDQDKVSGDFRAVLFEPKDLLVAPRNGLAFMAATVTGNVPISQSAHGAGTRAVAAYNMGTLVGAGQATGLREAYLLQQTVADEEHSHFKYITVGRFNVPFGLLTDEHRTYVRIQTKTTEFDYEMGGALSGDPSDQAHFDFALTNGFQNGGAALQTAPPYDFTWAAIGNIRVSPGLLPFFMGVSGSYHHTILADYNPWATSVYGALSLDRLTHNHLAGAILGEFVAAQGWNDTTKNPVLGGEVLPASDPLAAAVKDSVSMGLLVQGNYDLSSRWTLIYRFEELALDRRYPGDAFTRHGFGFRTFLSSNLDLTARYEISNAGRETITAANSLAATNDVLAVLHYWF